MLLNCLHQFSLITFRFKFEIRNDESMIPFVPFVINQFLVILMFMLNHVCREVRRNHEVAVQMVRTVMKMRTTVLMLKAKHLRNMNGLARHEYGLPVYWRAVIQPQVIDFLTVRQCLSASLKLYITCKQKL